MERGEERGPKALKRSVWEEWEMTCGSAGVKPDFEYMIWRPASCSLWA
jgi:hypothetical protein